MAQTDGLAFVIVGALFAGVALLIGSLLRAATNNLEESGPSKIFRFKGWSSRFSYYPNGKLGFALGVVGVFVGFIGMALHFYFMFYGSKHA